LLTNRWGIFWRPLRCAASKWATVCTVAAKLHNLCIDLNEGGGIHILERLEEDCEPGDCPLVYMNDTFDEVEEGERRPRGDRRRDITEQLDRDGFYRPTY
jgi:hypothetical protein